MDAPLLITDHKDDIQKKKDWLSGQFNRVPFQIYKLWLVLTFVIALGIEPILIFSFLYGFKNDDGVFKALIALEMMPLMIGCLFLLLGCIQMVLSMSRRKSESAQKGILKFQYSMITLGIHSFSGLKLKALIFLNILILLYLKSLFCHLLQLFRSLVVLL